MKTGRAGDEDVIHGFWSLATQRLPKGYASGRPRKKLELQAEFHDGAWPRFVRIIPPIRGGPFPRVRNLRWRRFRHLTKAKAGQSCMAH